jgi:hypothetical protein
MEAQSDTLVILDCCEAGLAAVASQNEENTPSEYRKELIGACGWDTSTRNHMSPGLCQILEDVFIKENRVDMSTFSLVRRLNNNLVKSKGRKGPPQAVHYILRRNMKDKMVLHKLDTTQG